jgi:multiple sugar transport system permease protein
MDYLESLPRRVVTLYLPLWRLRLRPAVPVLLDGDHVAQAERGAAVASGNPFWVMEPDARPLQEAALQHAVPEWMWNTVIVSVVSTFSSLAASVFAAYAIERLRFRGSKQTGLAIFLAYLVPPSILFIPLAAIVFKLGLFDTRWALILTYPTFLIPFCTWLLMGYFRSIPYELEECALIDGATRWQILVKIILPLAVPGSSRRASSRSRSRGTSSSTRSRSSFLGGEDRARGRGDRARRGRRLSLGALMAGALLGSLPVA